MATPRESPRARPVLERPCRALPARSHSAGGARMVDGSAIASRRCACTGSGPFLWTGPVLAVRTLTTSDSRALWPSCSRRLVPELVSAQPTPGSRACRDTSGDDQTPAPVARLENGRLRDAATWASRRYPAPPTRQAPHPSRCVQQAAPARPHRRAHAPRQPTHPAPDLLHRRAHRRRPATRHAVRHAPRRRPHHPALRHGPRQPRPPRSPPRRGLPRRHGRRREAARARAPTGPSAARPTRAHTARTTVSGLHRIGRCGRLGWA